MVTKLMRRSTLLLGALAGILFVPIYARATTASETQATASGWRAVATEQDRARIRGWRRTWVEGLRAAQGKHADAVEREGALLKPDAALLNPAPPAGDYRCRTIKLGAAGSGALDWVTYPEFRCRISRQGDMLGFTKIGGSQRPIGRIFPDGVRRMIFLGTLQLGDERQPLAYGSDEQRDMAGILERVGERQWRLVLPRPAFESVIDVVELVPAD